MLKYAILPLALIFVGACDDDKTGETGDIDTGEEEDTDVDPADYLPRVEEWKIPGCDASNQWVYGADISGWTNGDNLVNAYDQGAGADNRWNEETVLGTLSYEDNPPTEVLEARLTPGAALADYTPNENTLYTCAVHGAPGTMVYVKRIFDQDGNLEDCIAFSNEYDQGIADVLANPTGDDFNPVSDPSQISAANCEVL